MTQPAITVHNAQRKLRVDVAALQQFATAAFAQCAHDFPKRLHLVKSIEEITAVLVSDRRIAAIHRRFMNIAGATDVITFEHGEIVISVETAARQASEFGTSTEAELRLYVVHGILHLIGFDDSEPASAREMAEQQERIVLDVLARS